MAENVNGNVTIKINGKEVENTLKAIQREARVLRADLNKMTIGTDDYNKTVKQLQATDGILKKHRNEIAGIGKETLSLKGIMSNVVGGVGGGLGGAFLGAAGPIGLVTVGVGALFSGIGSGLSTMREFESELKKLEIRTGITKENIDVLSDSAVDLAVRFGAAPAAIAKAFGEAASARPELVGNTQALTDFTSQALILAQITGDDVNTSIASLTTIMNTNGIATSDAAETVNMLVGASQKGAKEIPFLAQAMEKIGGTAANANVGLAEQAAVIELLGEKYTSSAETAGTNVRNILITLQKEWEANNEGPFNFKEALDQLAPSVGSVTELTELFGKENVVAAQTLLQNRERLDELTKGISGFQGASDLAVESQRTLDGQTAILSARFDAFWASQSNADSFFSRVVEGFNMLLGEISAVSAGVMDFLTNSEVELAMKKQANATQQLYESRVKLAQGIVDKEGLDGAKQKLNEMLKASQELEKGSERYNQIRTAAISLNDAIEAKETEIEVAKKRQADAEASRIQSEAKDRQKRESDKLQKEAENLNLSLAQYKVYLQDRKRLEAEVDSGDFTKIASKGLSTDASGKTKVTAEMSGGADLEAMKDEQFKASLNKQLDTYKQFQDERSQLEIAADQDRNRRMLDTAIEGYEQVGSAIFQIMGASADRRTKRELKALDERKKQGLISEKEYEKERESIERAAFEKKKRLQTIEAILNGAVAVTKTLANLGWPAGAPAAIGVAAQTAAQVFIIRGQEYELGGEVNGPSHAGGGVPIVAEGGEFIVRKRAVNDFTLPLLKSINEAGNIPTINFSRVQSGMRMERGGSVPKNEPLATASNDELMLTVFERVMDKAVSKINDKKVNMNLTDLDDADDRREDLKVKQYI